MSEIRERLGGSFCTTFAHNRVFFYKSTQHQTHEYVGLRMVAVVRYVTVGQHSPHSGGVVGVNALIRPMTSSDTDLVKIFFIGYYLRNLTP